MLLTKYFLQGTFSNVSVSQFTTDGDTIVYDNGDAKYLFVTYGFGVSSNQNSTTITMRVTRNNVDMSGSVTTLFCKTGGEEYTIANIGFITPINHADKIKILISSDKAGAIINTIQGSAVAFQLP